MKNKLFILFIILSIGCTYAQSDSTVFIKHLDELNTKLSAVENQLDAVKANNQKTIRNYNKLLSSFNQYKMDAGARNDSLQTIIASNSVNIDGTAKNLGGKISDAEVSTSQSITELHQIIWQNMISWIIAVVLVTLFVIIVFIILKKQMFKLENSLLSKLDEHKSLMEQNLSTTKTSLNQSLKNTKRVLEKDLNDARKILGEDLINTRKVLSEDILKTRDILSEELQYSKKALEESIKGVSQTLAKDINDTKLFLEKENTKLDSKITKLREEQLKKKNKPEDS